MNESLLDTVDRLERVIDIQIDTLDGIDNKAEHITRLIATFIGVIIAALSIGVEFEAVDFSGASTPVKAGFLLGMIALLLSMYWADLPEQ